MKKVFILFVTIFILPSFGAVINDFSNKCGVSGYKRFYAIPVSVTCASGKFLPANSITCYDCPNGYTCTGGTFTFNPTMAQGVVLNGTILSTPQNMCATNTTANRMYAIPKSFTCLPEQFLPANAYECVSCPSGYTCSGGTYTFNSINAQGIVLNGYISNNTNNTCAKNTGHIINGRYVRNVHNCSPGYYLPANTDGCTICPLNNICIGGTYTFNETTNQGIESCDGSFAPIGSSVCYPHILHVGDDNIYLSATKRTTPSLNVAYGNEVFYANMTTVQTTMSANSEHYLKTIYNNEIYYVCDDTVYPQ